MTGALTPAEIDGIALYYWTCALHLHSKISFSVFKSIQFIDAVGICIAYFLIRRVFPAGAAFAAHWPVVIGFRCHFFCFANHWCSLNKVQSLIITEYRQLCCLYLITLLKVYLCQPEPVMWLQMLSEFSSKCIVISVIELTVSSLPYCRISGARAY